eukprot:jgi/Botrbrau1/19152/Bobra.0077s0064.1
MGATEKEKKGKKKKSKDEKSRKRPRSEERSEKLALKLSLYSALGEHRKVRKLLDKHPPPDVNAHDKEGITALHQAARFGHGTLVELLLDAGADPMACDVQHNTPAHVAASKGYMPVVNVLIKAGGSSLLQARNLEGVTVAQLIEAAADRSERLVAAQQQQAELPERGGGSDWEQKLREEAQADFGWQEDFWDSYGAEDTPYCEAGPFGAGFDSQMEEEEYARHIWEEMSRRQSTKKARVGPVLEEHWRETERLTSERRRKAQAAEDAKQRSRKILDEERDKDARWREAVLRGDLGARRAAYEAKWHTFTTSQAKGAIHFGEVPWLVEELEDARAVILYGTRGREEERRRIRTELMRWHPDKFEAKFASRLHAPDRQRVLDKVKHISQMLTGLVNTLSDA